MPRTASTIDGSPDYRTLSLRLLDVSGDQRSVSFRIATGALSTDIEAFVDEFASVTGASVFRVEITDGYAGAESVTNASSGGKSDSVYDNVVMLYSDVAAARSENLFIPAPASSVMIDDTDNVDLAGLADLRTAFDAIKFGTPTLKSVRYSERREINSKTRV